MSNTLSGTLLEIQSVGGNIVYNDDSNELLTRTLVIHA